jgi:hypothetical protein
MAIQFGLFGFAFCWIFCSEMLNLTQSLRLFSLILVVPPATHAASPHELCRLHCYFVLMLWGGLPAAAACIPLRLCRCQIHHKKDIMDMYEM